MPSQKPQKSPIKVKISKASSLCRLAALKRLKVRVPKVNLRQTSKNKTNLQQVKRIDRMK